MPINSVTINSKTVSNGDTIKVVPGNYTVEIARDFKDYPRVRFGGHDVDSADKMGQAWPITVPNGNMELLITRWDSKTNSYSDKIKVTVIGANSEEPAKMIFGICGLCQHDFQAANKLAEDLGCVVCREWVNTDDFKEYKPKNWKRIKEYHDNGYQITLCTAQSGLTPAMVSDSRNVSNWFKALIKDLADNDITARIELGNEPNLPDYWSDPEPDKVTRTNNYVLAVQKIAYETIKAESPKTVCLTPGISWDAELINTIKNGLCLYCDGIAYHPYPNGTDSTLNGFGRIARAKQIADALNLPLVLTEAQFNGGQVYKTLTSNDARQKHLAAWALKVAKMYGYCRELGVAEFHYFVATPAKKPNGDFTTNSPAALFTKDATGLHPTQFYQAIDGVM